MFLLEESRPFYISRRALNLLGVLPRQKNGRTPYFPVIMAGMSLTLTALAVHVFIAIRDDVDVDISVAVADFVASGLITVIAVLFYYKQSKWTQIMDDVIKFNFFEKPSNFVLVCRYGNTLTLTFTIYLVCGFVFYAWNQHLIGKECVEPDLKNGFMFCGSFGPLWLPFDLDSFSFALIFLFQFLTPLYSLITTSLAVMTVFDMSRFLILHFNTLRDNIKNISSKYSLEENRSRYRVCIQYHIHILRMAEDLKQLVMFTIGAFTPVCAVAFGVLENHMTKTNRTGAALYLFGYLFATFIICDCSQRLADASQSVADEVFGMDWYNVNKEISKNVTFIIARAQKPSTFKGFPNLVISYQLYVLLLKTSYSYLTILTTAT